jgi:thiamine biosynthesis lipoprotein
METITVARHAMATRFEMLLQGENGVALRAAAEQALDEIERLEAQLSLFRPASEISMVNRHAASRPVRVSPPVFRLLRQARQLHHETAGSFDVTVAPLVRCWGFQGGRGALAPPEAVAQARRSVGMQWVELDEANYTVRFAREGMMLDLGAIGKGYAIDCAAEVLREAGVTCALSHGGTSSVYALGAPPDAEAWTAAIPQPDAPEPPEPGLPRGAGSAAAILATVALKDESLGISGVLGRCFRAQGRTYGHVIDPRSGEPVQRAVLAAVVLPSATETDALSTALLTLGPDGFEAVLRLRAGMRALLAVPEDQLGRFRIITHRITLAEA